MRIGLLINENYEYVIDLFNKHKVRTLKGTRQENI